MCGEERTAGAGTVNCAAVALWRRGETPVLALHGEVGGAVRCPAAAHGEAGSGGGNGLGLR